MSKQGFADHIFNLYIYIWNFFTKKQVYHNLHAHLNNSNHNKTIWFLLLCLKQSLNNYIIIWLTQASISETEAGRHEFEAILVYIVSSRPTRAPQWDSVLKKIKILTYFIHIYYKNHKPVLCLGIEAYAFNPALE